MCNIDQTLQDIIVTLSQMENDIAVIKEDMTDISADIWSINNKLDQMLERDD